MSGSNKHFAKTILSVLIAMAMFLTSLPFTVQAVYAAVGDEPAAAALDEQTEQQETPAGGQAETDLDTEQEGTEAEGVQTELPAAEDETSTTEEPEDTSLTGGEATQATDGESAGEAESVEGSNDMLEAAPLEVTAESYSGTYNAKAHTITLSGVPEGAVVEYSKDGTTWSTAEPSRKSAGTTTVYYRVTAADGRTVEGQATIKISKAKLKSAKLSTTAFAYNGKAREPKVTVYGKVTSSKLKKGTDYTIKLASGRKKVGKYTITIKGKGNYTGTITKTMTVKPAKVYIKSKSLSCGTLKVKTKKSASKYGAAYFQIAYKKSGGSWKYVKSTTASKTLSVKEANTYYVKVRAVRKVNGKTYNGNWSKTYKVVNKIPVKAQKVINAAHNTPFAGQGWCAAWVCNVFNRSGVLTSARLPYASDYYRKYCTSSDRDDLKPGMIVASRLSYAGGYAGHIGIYIGNGKVISNETRITIKTLDQFAAAYGHGYPIKWGWMNGKKLL